MTKAFPFLLFLAAALALGLRCARLDARPMHTDEAVKAVKIFRQLWEGGPYRYDPTEHHGPTLVYATLAWGKLTFAPDFEHWTEARLRSVTVLFGVGLVVLLFLVADGLGRPAAVAAAFLTAVSPMMVYYSRDYIHETLLVFFTFLAMAAGWRYFQTRRFAWILLAGLAIGLMQATKETFIFNLAAAAAAGFLTWRLSPPRAGKAAKPLSLAHLMAAVAAWAIVVWLFFTSFFTYPNGLLDAVRTFAFWTRRAEGSSPHIHAWYFYWRRLLWFQVKDGPVWSEGLIFALAIIGVLAAFKRRPLLGAHAGFIKFLAFYTVILAAIYTAIPYKTPWCALGFWHGAILLAGVGAAAFFSWLPRPAWKPASSIILFAGAAWLGVQAWQAAVPFGGDPRNPWAYAQTSPDILNLVRKVNALAQVSPDGHGLLIKVMAPDSDYYPLPWYLRAFLNSGWWEEVPGSPKFSVGEIGEVDAFVATLRAQSGGVSKFLMDSGLKNSIDDAQNDPYKLQTNLVESLNHIVEGPSIYDSNRFQNVRFRSATDALRRTDPHGQDLVRLNRLLLEDAYPGELARNQIPEDPYAPVMIVSPQFDSELDDKKAGIMTGLFELRPGTFLELYVQSNLWHSYLRAEKSN